LRRARDFVIHEGVTLVPHATGAPTPPTYESPDPAARLEALASETHFRRLLEKLPAAAYTCDPEGLITYYNENAVRMWGRAPRLNDHEDRYCGSFRLFAVGGAAIRHDQCWMALALRERREFNGHEIVIERPDGDRLTALAHANPILDDAGSLMGAVNVLVDITDRKRAEDALREADRHRNDFLATLSHELRNPLAPIRNAVQVLQLQGQTPEQRWAIDVIDRQTRHMTRLIDDLLDISRITRNHLELRTRRASLAEIFEAAVEICRPCIDRRGHALIVESPAQEVHLEADPARLAQAVANLLHNSAKYTPDGGSIRLSARRSGEDAIVTVKDTGIGIPAEALPRVFEMFVQADRSIGRAEGGLGVGLALVRRIVELHGGEVTAQSDGPGLGSEFVIRLPVAPARAA
jgi:signal transduction histidine kinase